MTLHLHHSGCLMNIIKTGKLETYFKLINVFLLPLTHLCRFLGYMEVVKRPNATTKHDWFHPLSPLPIGQSQAK